MIATIQRRLQILCVFLVAGSTAWASTVDATLFNAATNAGGDDPAGLGTNFAATSSIGGDTVEDAFGNNDGGIEPTTFLFADGQTADNGNATLGDGGESVDNITWQTTSFVIIDGYRLDAAPDGTDNLSRGIELAQFSVQSEIDDLFDKDHGGGVVDRLFVIPQVGDSFQLDVSHTNSQGARVNEIDALTTDTSAAVVNTTIFNATTNTGGDEAAGFSFNFTHSALVGGDTPEDAFGNNDGGVEGSTVLFADGGTADNANNTFGDGGETVDFIQWNTTSKVQLNGYEVQLDGDGGVQGAARSTQLIRFFVNGNLVDIFDANGFSGTFDRLFAGGSVVGNIFRIELTRSTSGVSDGGPRLLEVNALNALVVPIPQALPAGVSLLSLLALWCRRSA